jgi:hypothetical protein
MTWLAGWLPQAPERLWHLEVVLAVLLALSIVASAGFGFLLWRVSGYRAEVENATVSADLDKTRGELAAAKAQANADLARTRAELAQADAKVAELETRQAARQIAPDRRDELVRRLKPGAGTRVLVMATIGDAERMNYASSFAQALTAAGWDVAAPGVMQFAIAATGVHIGTRDAGQPNQGAKILLDALAAIGVAVQLDSLGPNADPQVVHLIVGGKQ